MPKKTCVNCGHAIAGRRRKYCSAICRFWSFVDRSSGPDGCWPWIGSINKRDRYGQYDQDIDGKPRRRSAHRMAYWIAKGDPGPLLVRHTCDFRPCCNPRHLLTGTHLDNTMDAHVRDRPVMARYGETNRCAKLTEQAVNQIRASADPAKVLAARFGVVPSRINAIRRGQAWRHLLA